METFQNRPPGSGSGAQAGSSSVSPAKLLIQEQDIKRRIKDLAPKIENHYRGLENPLLCLVVTRGALFFAADLLRELKITYEIDFISARSYVGGARTDDLKISYTGIRLKNRMILLIEDIVDSGKTIEALEDFCFMNGASSVRVVSLLVKPRSSWVDWAGFDHRSGFVFGYGMDDEQGLNRGLADIYERG